MSVAWSIGCRVRIPTSPPAENPSAAGSPGMPIPGAAERTGGAMTGLSGLSMSVGSHTTRSATGGQGCSACREATSVPRLGATSPSDCGGCHGSPLPRAKADSARTDPATGEIVAAEPIVAMPPRWCHDQETSRPRAIIAVVAPTIDPFEFRAMRIPLPPPAQHLVIQPAQ